jgi:hypothetical protein
MQTVPQFAELILIILILILHLFNAKLKQAMHAFDEEMKSGQYGNLLLDLQAQNMEHTATFSPSMIHQFVFILIASDFFCSK